MNIAESVIFYAVMVMVMFVIFFGSLGVKYLENRDLCSAEAFVLNETELNLCPIPFKGG